MQSRRNNLNVADGMGTGDVEIGGIETSEEMCMLLIYFGLEVKQGGKRPQNHFQKRQGNNEWKKN